MALRLRARYPPARTQGHGPDVARDPSGAPPRAGSRARGPRSVTARLVVAVLLPITVLSIGAVALLRQRYDTARQAAAIVAEVPTLNRLADLRQLLDQEAVPIEGRLRARQFGFDLPNVSASLNFSPEPLAQARAAMDAALRRLGPNVPRGFAAALASVRRELDSFSLTPWKADEALDGLDADLALSFAERLDDLRREVAGLGGGAALQAALTSLGAANRALSAAVRELGDVSELSLPGPHGDAQVSRLGADAGALQAAGDSLRAAGGQTAALWTAFTSNASERDFQRLAGAAANGQATPASSSADLTSLVALAGTFRAGLIGQRRLYALLDAAERQVSARAAALSADNASQLRMLLGELLLAIGLTIVLALLIARTITGPLGLLAARARAVQRGDLEALVPTSRGPRETVVVSEAFNDLVNNLRLMERQTRALSDCAFEDPVLSQRLPGRLGRALHESVEVLSGSILERDSLQQRLVHQATHDALTGLHNRAATLEFLEQALGRAQRSGTTLAALYVDLDDFKRANDTHGHTVGDTILKEIAGRLGTATRRGDFVARLGGDEFLVIAESLDDPGEATALGEALLAAVARPLQTQSLRVSLGASIGVALAGTDAADTPSQVLARADLAVHRAKAAGSGRVGVYDEDLQGALLARAAVERDLDAALDAGGDGLFLVYQPVVDARSGEMRSVEALVRWERRGAGLCQPGDFIPAAEQSDLIIRLDCWVLGAALAQLARWEGTPYAQTSIAVNVSGRHLLSGQLSRHVEAALSAAAVEPGRLILEVTETVLLGDMATVAGELARLRMLGIRVAIDDFGTGYTSLAHLQRLVVDELKIDRSFVEQLSGEGSSPLVRMVTDLGHQLGVSVVAEGIETDEQLALLREIGCDALQGFLIGRPQDLKSLERWRAEREPVERAA